MSLFKLRLPGGSLKLKTLRQLRRREHERKVPVLKVGFLYVIWWPSRMG